MIWIAGIFLALIGLGTLFGGKKNGRASSERPRTRIDHPHYSSEDEYECSVCGTRFGRASMVCPHCGVRFNRTETDHEEFDEDLDTELWLDEMDEEDH